jgi:hypothetical protein
LSDYLRGELSDRRRRATLGGANDFIKPEQNKIKNGAAVRWSAVVRPLARDAVSLSPDSAKTIS